MLFVGGPSAAVRSAAVGAILLALIEGIGICITRMTADQFKPGLTLTVILLIIYMYHTIFCCHSMVFQALILLFVVL